MFLALLSAGYMLSLLTADPCVSEVENIPSKNETIAYKCFPPNHKLPKDDTRVSPSLLPPSIRPVETKLAEAKAKQQNPYKKRTKKRDNRK